MQVIGLALVSWVTVSDRDCPWGTVAYGTYVVRAVEAHAASSNVLR
jgi:hypothetical protein